MFFYLLKMCFIMFIIINIHIICFVFVSFCIFMFRYLFVRFYVRSIKKSKQRKYRNDLHADRTQFGTYFNIRIVSSELQN